MFSHLGWQDGTIRGALSTIKNSLVVTSLPYFWTSGSYVILIVIIQEYLDTCAQSLLERPWSACNPTLITLRCPQSYTNQPANTLVLKKDMFTHYTCFQENITNHTFTNTFGNLIFLSKSKYTLDNTFDESLHHFSFSFISFAFIVALLRDVHFILAHWGMVQYQTQTELQWEWLSNYMQQHLVIHTGRPALWQNHSINAQMGYSYKLYGQQKEK